MKIAKIKYLLGLKADGKANNKILLELEKEKEKIMADFKFWVKQVDNFLFYVDKTVDNDIKKRDLYYRGLDPIEAGEILIRL